MAIDQDLASLHDQLMVGCVQLTRFHEMSAAAARRLSQQDAVPDAALATLGQFLEQSRDDTLTLELEDTGETITLTRSEATYLHDLAQMGLDIEVRYPRIANDMMLIYLTTLFEAFVLDSARVVMQHIARLVRRGQTGVRRQTDGPEPNRVLVSLIRQQVRDLEYRSIQIKLRFMADTLGVGLEDAPPTPADLDELYATRNLLVHNRGVVNRRYLRDVRNSPLRIGDVRRVDDEYVHAAIATVRTAGEHLFRGLAARYAPGAETRLEEGQRLMERIAALLEMGQ